jgi:acyl carrier protein
MRTVPVRRRWPFGAGLELDSLDFEALVVQLSERSGHRIDEDDYPQLTTVGSCVDYLASRAP